MQATQSRGIEADVQTQAAAIQQQEQQPAEQHAGQAILVVLELLQGGWVSHCRDASEVDHVRLFFKGPAMFALPGMQGSIHCGVHSGDKRKALLLDAAVVPLLQRHLSQQLLDLRQQQQQQQGHAGPKQQRQYKQQHDREDNEVQTEGSLPVMVSISHHPEEASPLSGHPTTDKEVTVDDRSRAEGSMGTELVLPGLDALPRTLAGQQYVDVCVVDMSDADKSLAVFKDIMKHNKEVKRLQQQNSRLAEAKKQLQHAQQMVACCRVPAPPPPDAAAAAAELPAAALAASGSPADAQNPSGCAEARSVSSERGASQGHTSPLPVIPLGSGAEGPCSVMVCIDMEWYEADQSRLLEIGWSCWDSVSGAVESKHWIVEENLYCNNGRYVPNHKHDFGFGTSTIGPKRDGAKALQQDINPETWACRWGHQRGMPLPIMALVGHGMAADLKLLDSMAVVIAPGTHVIDTNSLAWAVMGGKQIQHSLRALLGWLQVPHVKKLHNAGNDARYTLEAALRMIRL